MIQSEQPKIFRPAQWQVLSRMVLLAVLLTQQAWAGWFCCCDPIPKTQPVFAQSALPVCHAAKEAVPSAWAETETPPAPLRIEMCCARPQVEAEQVALPTSNQPSIPSTLLPLTCQTLATSIVKVGGNSPAPLQRPLYLALSCWLI